MTNPFRVGVVLNEWYNPLFGGGFNYYQNIIEFIDNSTFDKSIEFVFIQFFENDNLLFKKEHIKVEVQQKNKNQIIIENDLLKLKKNLFCINRTQKIKNKEVQLQIESENHKQKISHYKKKILLINKIEILYYLTPDPRIIDFPFIATHWDIGHLSTYAFPEFVSNNNFEDREKLYEISYKKALGVICESIEGKNELSHYKLINPQKIHILPLLPATFITQNKLSENQVEEILKQKFCLKKKSYFFYPAQFWPHKNHYGLLLAFNKFSKLHAEIKLVLSGSDKGNLNYLKEIINDLSLESLVLLPGFVSNEEIISLYKGAISLVMPTFLGPTNMPLIEAKLLGCKVITSDMLGHRNALDNQGVFIDPLDINSIYKAMCHVYSTLEFEPEISPIPNFNFHSNFENIFNKIMSIKRNWKIT